MTESKVDVLGETPMVNSSYGTKEPEFRMDAYYYGFNPTGVLAIDRILSAVASAGKASHSTEDWREPESPWEPFMRGDNPVEWIQYAADDAAEAIRAALAACTPAKSEGG